MLTAYTARMAELLDPCCDALLVGDSLAQTIYGLPSTVPVTLDTMIAHGAAGARAHRAGGGGHALRQLRSQSRASLRVGLPRAEGNRRGRHQAGRRRGHGGHGRLPVGARHPRHGTRGPDAAGGEHPGRLRARGRGHAEQAKIAADAEAIAAAGAFAVVVEGVVEPLAASIAASLSCPVIGIGASASCDGQVLVVDDMLGMFERTARFVKRYDTLSERIQAAARTYSEVKARRFPGPEHLYEAPKA